MWDHIAADNPRAAARMDELFSDAVVRLAGYPMLGRPGKVPGTRELVPHESYRLAYELERETVWVLALVHTSSNGRHGVIGQTSILGRLIPTTIRIELPEASVQQFDLAEQLALLDRRAKEFG